MHNLQSPFLLLDTLVALVVHRKSNSLKMFVRARMRRMTTSTDAEDKDDTKQARNNTAADNDTGRANISLVRFKDAYEQFCFEHNVPQKGLTDKRLKKLGIKLHRNVVKVWSGVRWKTEKEAVLLDAAPQETESPLAWFVRAKCRVTRLPVKQGMMKLLVHIMHSNTGATSLPL